MGRGRREVWRSVALVTVLASGLALVVIGCGAPAQIGTDREAFKSVDALFTAVSMKDAGQLGRCEASLKALRDSGKLPSAAADQLEAIVADARGGGWESARDRLRAFMDGQYP